MPTRLNQPAALTPTRILEPKRHSSDKTFSATKAQIRQRISQLSINKNKVHNESHRRNTGEHQEKEGEEFHYLHVNAVMPSEAYVWEKNVARKPSRPFDSKDAHKLKVIASLPSISTSPSTFSFPEQPLRESISKSIDLCFNEAKTDSFISSSTMDNPPPTPPPKITIQSDEQATPKATQVAFNIATVARRATSVNSFTGNGSFLGLPEEADMFYRSNAVWDDLEVSQDQQASHKKCAATQHLSPTNAGQQKRLKVADLQFADADSEAGRTNGKGSCDLNDTMEKSEPLDKPLPHLPDDNGPSEYSISTYSQWSAVILKANLGILWPQPTFATNFSSDREQPRREVHVERESTRTRHGQSGSSRATANAIQQSQRPAGSTLTRNLIHTVSPQEAFRSVLDHSIASAKPIMNTMTNRINSVKGSESTKRSFQLDDHAVLRPKATQDQTIDSLVEDDDVEIIGDLTFASSRPPSVSSSINTMKATSFASVTAIHASRLFARSQYAHNTSSQGSRTYPPVRVRSQSEDSVPHCPLGISTIFPQSERVPIRKGHKSILDPFSSFDPHVPIVPCKTVPNDDWILITNTAEDDILRNGWKDVEMRWMEGESFREWMMRRIRGELWNTVVLREKRADEQLRMMELSDGKG
ncbi:hypothetical protein I305_06149 [Cryptococcus gattii E566]|uniref:Uncharacterized protein n=1 Tax=Cryptococcus gattii serotype B (strain WM276 / ATCC MYA-4071) TaxID=367775 RepID=E6RCQ0_CRYGW|nr:Hypothetical Protein CGB_J1130W [Cryptococcus gattii WM276]ADV24603.1 Hypothetical Protein CGB_J1130W [Cryptococcus gattii WM276]KIY31461.1 hypothetical protein I305_06149 [Cryptococcus gattii E566]